MDEETVATQAAENVAAIRLRRKYTSGVEILKNEAKTIFMALLEHTPTQVGYLVGLDKYYKTDSSLRSAVYRAYQSVLDNPEAQGISLELAKQVQEKVSSRSLTMSLQVAKKKAEKASLDKVGTAELVSKGTERALKLVHRKFDELEKGGAIKNVKLAELVKAAAILFDKGQLARGEATQNIAVLSKSIDSNMSAEDALDMILQSREAIAIQKEAIEEGRA